MPKYAALGEFLRAQSGSEVPMSFLDIEKVIGSELPPSSKKYPAWWSNNPSNNVMTKIWLTAGFQTERVDIPGRKLVFRRSKRISDPSASQGMLVNEDGKQGGTGRRRHPIFGCMKGTITIAPGVDLTQPLWDEG